LRDGFFGRVGAGLGDILDFTLQFDRFDLVLGQTGDAFPGGAEMVPTKMQTAGAEEDHRQSGIPYRPENRVHGCPREQAESRLEGKRKAVKKEDPSDCAEGCVKKRVRRR